MHVVVPLKDFDYVKQRLASCLSPMQRRSLFYAMVKDVLAALSAAELVEEIFLLSDDPLAEELSKTFGVQILSEASLFDKRRGLVEEDGGGLNAALQAAVVELAERGVSSVMILHGDLPFVSPIEIDSLVASYRSCKPATVALVSDHKGEGTNAMVFEAGHAPDLAFGVDSFRCHRESAERKALELLRLSYTGIENDIDEPCDLDMLSIHRDDELAYNSREFFMGCKLSAQSPANSSIALP